MANQIGPQEQSDPTMAGAAAARRTSRRGGRAARDTTAPDSLLVRRAMGTDLHDVRVVLSQPRIDASGVCF
jgi:hypothetical protein